ncbi:MAG: mobile mystery protein A [Nevskia sp.]|nr:mobile mystery protein A [Nevskia sp.]
MSRNHRQILRDQTRQPLDAAAGQAGLRPPKLGWIKTARLALGMSGAALSARLGGTRTLAANLERSEREGRISLKSMQDAASAMNCRFVYAIVPVASDRSDETVTMAAVVEAQAERVARRMVKDAAVHMALEAQQLGGAESEREVQRLKDQLLRDLPRDLWAPARDEQRG